MTPPDDRAEARDAITVQFPGLTLAEASGLARELEMEFHAEGLSAGQVRVARDNAETMDFGATLLIGAGVLGWEALKGAAKTLGAKAGGDAHALLRRKIDAFCLRRRVAAQVAVPGEGKWFLHSEFEQADTPARHPSDLGVLGVVLLGASVFPRMEGLDNPSFARSAAAAKALFAAPGPVFRDTAVLDLFDQDVTPQAVADAIEAHIDVHPGMTDVLLYYCGHGSFLRDRTYFLTLRGTRPGREASTGLQLRVLRHDLEAKLANRRLYLILDCCFAGAAVKEFMGPDVGRVVETAVHEALPPGGWLVLAAASSSVPAMAPAGQDLTMFTGALDQVLRRAERPLSFDDMATETRRVIQGSFGANGVLPECHAPRQIRGDLRRVPLFGGRAAPPALVQTPKQGLAHVSAKPVRPAPAVSMTDDATRLYAMLDDKIPSGAAGLKEIIAVLEEQEGASPRFTRTYVLPRGAVSGRLVTLAKIHVATLTVWFEDMMGEATLSGHRDAAVTYYLTMAGLVRDETLRARKLAPTGSTGTASLPLDDLLSRRMEWLTAARIYLHALGAAT